MENSTQIVNFTQAKLLAGRVLEFLLPSRCPCCGAKIECHGFLCGRCWGDLVPLASPYCERCALPFEFEIEGESECGACIKDQPAFDWARAAVSYDELGRSLVFRLKYSGATSVVPAMAQMMALAVTGKKIDVIVPVPLHRWRLLRRRFNQSALLGHAIAKRIDVPNDNFILKRRKSTVSQGELGKKARYRNVASAFVVPKEKVADVKGKHVLLVDDVLTTGATVHECARALKRAGAASVGVVTFARVGRPIAG
ncbi:MAG: phosphoribosyltransferase family protein [Kordiimonas sp.]